jgi:hypothetical protein
MASRLSSLPCIICAVFVLAPNFASAHSRIQATNSLADLAREQRLKTRESKQPAKVYTNDDIPANPTKSESTPFLAINLPTGTVDGKSQAGSVTNALGSAPHDEKYFRDRMNQLRANLKSDKEDLASLQEEMNKHLSDNPRIWAPSLTFEEHMRWTTDPIGTQNFWVSEDKRLRTSIDSQREKIADDEKDISDFVDQCRRESCEPGWIR